jgi:hypothetical protein
MIKQSASHLKYYIVALCMSRISLQCGTWYLFDDRRNAIYNIIFLLENLGSNRRYGIHNSNY